MSDENIGRALEEIGQTLREQPSVRAGVMQRVVETGMTPRPQMPRYTIGTIGAVAAGVLVLVLVPILRAGDGAREAFAAAVQSVAKARTFSCHQTMTRVVRGKKTLQEMAIMFKEPDLERGEYLEGYPNPGETTITDYTKRQRLHLNPKDKSAVLYDLSSSYTTDKETGAVKLTELDRYERDLVMKLTAEAVKDVGMQKLDGKDVRVLRSTGKQTVRTVYVDPESKLPVKITIFWPASGQTETVAPILIDAKLDESLFSLDVPTGYALFQGHIIKPHSDSDGKMVARLMRLALACLQYRSGHGNQFPAALADLTKTELSNSVFKTLVAEPDELGGAEVVLYHRPRAGKDVGNEIMVYEDPARRQDGKVLAAFADGHASVLTKEEFEELMK